MPTSQVRDVTGQWVPISKRARAELRGKESPSFHVPRDLVRYVEWFNELDANYRPVAPDGAVNPIGPWLGAWERDLGALLDYADRRILLAMDQAYQRGMGRARAEYMRNEQKNKGTR